jgi:hypothetical protein
MDIDKLIGVYQKRFEKTVNASRILPSLLSHVDTVLGVKRFLERLKGMGVREVVLMKLPRDTTELRHPYPQEVIEFIRKVRGHGLDVFTLGVFLSRGKAFVDLQDVATGFRIYVVVPNVSIPEDWLGKPDMDYNGLKMYSVEKFKEYINKCMQYIENYYSGEKAKELVKSLRSYLDCLDERDIIGYIPIFCGDAYTQATYFRDGYYIVSDSVLRDRGVRAVERIPLPDCLKWIISMDGKFIMAVPDQRTSQEVESKYNAWVEYFRMMSKLLRSFIPVGCSEGFVRLPVKRFIKALHESGIEELGYGKIIDAVKKCCGELYLADYSQYTYVELDPSLPLNILYLSRLLRTNGFSGRVITAKSKTLQARRKYYVMILEEQFSINGKLYSLTARPKKNLRVRYPSSIKIEDGCLVIIDKNALESALKVA